MNTKNLELHIPEAIATLRLPIGEKVVLAHISKFPGCSNARLAELIGISCRGVENLLRRLRQQGYIDQSGKGRARRHHLLFHVERHISCGDGEAKISGEKSHTSRGDQPGGGSGVQSQQDVVVLRRELTWEEDLDKTLDMIHELCVGGDVFPESIVSLYEMILKRVVEEAPQCPEKDAMVRELTKRRDGFFAISFGTRLPRKLQYEAARLIRTATPEKLAEIRERVLAGQVGDTAPLMLAALATDGEVVATGLSADAQT